MSRDVPNLGLKVGARGIGELLRAARWKPKVSESPEPIALNVELPPPATCTTRCFWRAIV
jgi:hypothetical protein